MNKTRRTTLSFIGGAGNTKVFRRFIERISEIKAAEMDFLRLTNIYHEKLAIIYANIRV